VAQRLQRYTQANAIFLKRGALLPDGATPPLVAYAAVPEATQLSAAPAVPGVSITSAEAKATATGVRLSAVFASGDSKPSRVFVPLAVMSSENGRELQEVYGQALQLPPGGSHQVQLQLPLPQPEDCKGRCYVSVFPSDPDSGKAIGQGRYHLLVDTGSTVEKQ
jgi:hypothetical protein